VDPAAQNIPHYYDIIKNPMDFQTIRHKLDKKKYKSLSEFESDIRLIFSNCYLFNPPQTQPYISGQIIEALFEKEWPLLKMKLVATDQSEFKSLSQSSKTKIPNAFPEVKECREVLDFLYSMEADIVHFQKPVDKDKLPIYYEIIEHPMDFGSIERKLSMGEYRSYSEFKDDVQLIFSNAKKFNEKGSIIADSAERLSTAFKGRVMDSIVSDTSNQVPSSASRSIVKSKQKESSRDNRLTVNSTEGKKIMKILSKLQSHHLAIYFNAPVDPIAAGIPEYRDIISDPMDFGTIKSKLMNNEYPSVSQFCKDIELTFSNCFKFNPPGDPVHLAGLELRDLYLKEMKSLKLDTEVPLTLNQDTQKESGPLSPKSPLTQSLRNFLNRIMMLDVATLFLYPVSIIEYPDYPEKIQYPMDMTTMSLKLENDEYMSLSDFEKDIRLIISNCLSYNKPGTYGYRQGQLFQTKFNREWKSFMTSLPEVCT